MSDRLLVNAGVKRGEIWRIEPWRLGIDAPSFFAVHPETLEELPEDARKALEEGPAMLDLRRALAVAHPPLGV